MPESDVLQAIFSSLEKINGRLDDIEKRLDKIEQRLDRVEQRLDKVEQRLDVVEMRLDRLEQRVAKLEEDVQAIKQDIVMLKENDKELTRRMNAVYDQVAFLTEFRTEMIMFRDEVYKRFDNLEQQTGRLKEGFEYLRDMTVEHEIDIRFLKRVVRAS
jgi:chromosome segregation ATPase